MTEDKKDKKKPSRNQDYSVFLIIGLPMFVLGITTANPAFLAVGITFFIIGLSNRGGKKKTDETEEMPTEDGPESDG